MHPKKLSFPALFTVICLSVMVGITVSVSALFFITFRTTSYKQLETNTHESLSHLRDKVVDRFQEWAGLVRHTAISVVPDMTKQPADQKAIQRMLQHILDSQTDVTLLYCSTNGRWNEPGEFMVFNIDFEFPPDYDNTQRNWFIAAKENPGPVAYADPYIDVVTKTLITSLSIVVFDEAGRELGVVAGDVSIDFLDELLRQSAFVSGQETFFLNETGQFMTHPDPEAVLQKDFFTEYALEQYRDAILGSPSFSRMEDGRFIYSVAIPEMNWFLVSTLPRTAIFAESTNILIKMIAVNLLLVVLAVIMSIVLTRILKNEREEISAMKDNLKVGFFLMDQHYTIQGQYSLCLESMLEVPDLKGKNFVSLLSASLNERELNTLKDYFDMVLHRSFEQAMLEDINPLQDFQYSSAADTQGKTLSCSFTPVERGGAKKVFILGTIQDITVEKELQRKLAQEEQKLQEEMRSLFELIQVEPRVFSDFLEDIEYEFERIQEVLEGTDGSSPKAVVDIYQSVHAIKSNALIVGLTNFSDKVHTLESHIKELREQEGLLFEDIRDLTTDIDTLMEEKDKFRTTIDQVRSLKLGAGPSQYGQVLVDTLNRASMRAAEDLGKEVRFVADRVDSDALEQIPRRVVKEALIQLVRNAVYHGIEHPDERVRQGKHKVGTIKLSLEIEGDTIRFTLKDDGRGINFEDIREKADKLGIILPEATRQAQNRLLQVIFMPGFSTAETEGVHAGRGMGLNLVYERIRKIKGRIKVQTESGKGTAFSLYIPQHIKKTF
ncbi:MAG: Hpt domain-containing protein [Treponema sp.]|jgi:two-component system chemotaxis sensor kinase CheA|nr:Hpt domain-containing protein [Treponema sp.]